MRKFILRLLTFLTHPSTFFYYRRFKGTVIYPHVKLQKSKYMRITNCIICRYSFIKAFPLSKEKTILINIDNSYFGEYAFINSSGNLDIKDATFAPNVFIGTYKHSLTNSEHDSCYKISINKPKLIGQNVSIVGNVTINPGAVIGACSVVTKDAEENCMYVGNPAIKIKTYNKETDSWIKC